MKVKKIPMRMCVGCKELKPKKELLRIVALPTGLIELDRTGKKSGAEVTDREWMSRYTACLAFV